MCEIARMWMCFYRKECETVSKSLQNQGISADVYHAGLPDKQRQNVQAKWINNHINVICATIGEPILN